MAKLGFNFEPSIPDLIEDRHAYFAEYRVALEDAKAAIAGEADVESDVEEDDGEMDVVILEPTLSIEPNDLPASAKAVFLAATALGWEPRAWRSRTLHKATLYKSMSESHSTGDVRYPAKEARNYFLTGKHAGGRLGFTAKWTGVDSAKMKQDWEDRAFMSSQWWAKYPKDPAGVKTGGFTDAIVYDPYGLPVEMRGDYSPSKHQRETQGEAKAALTAQGRDYDYNDGEEAVLFSKFVSNATELSGWIDQWLTMLAPTHKKLSKKVAEKAPVVPVDQGVALIEQGEWSSE